jgi:hypothetical protein
MEKMVSRKDAKSASLAKFRNKLLSPPPGLPRQGGGVLSSLPWREGLREGDKIAASQLKC